MTADPNAGVHKSWAFTCNNYSQTDLMVLDNLSPALFTYLVFGQELAPTTGTPHLQGYLVFRKPHRRTAVTRMLTSRFILSVAKKGDLANTRYCSKGANVRVRDYRYGRSIDYVPRLVTSTSDIEEIIRKSFHDASKRR